LSSRYDVVKIALDSRRPIAILFSALMVSVIPLAMALYKHGHMNFAAVLKNAFG